jgi:SOS-response transcriptional repressor LexA
MFTAVSPDLRGPEMRPPVSEVRPSFTARQGQYLAFIHAYRRLHGHAPAEVDFQRFFRVSPPSVHQMIVKLEQAGLVTRQPGVARSISLAIDPKALPGLESRDDQPVKTSVQRY